jgi:hypothetical protein
VDGDPPPILTIEEGCGELTRLQKEELLKGLLELQGWVFWDTERGAKYRRIALPSEAKFAESGMLKLYLRRTTEQE